MRRTENKQETHTLKEALDTFSINEDTSVQRRSIIFTVVIGVVFVILLVLAQLLF